MSGPRCGAEIVRRLWDAGNYVPHLVKDGAIPVIPHFKTKYRNGRPLKRPLSPLPIASEAPKPQHKNKIGKTMHAKAAIEVLDLVSDNEEVDVKAERDTHSVERTTQPSEHASQVLEEDTQEPKQAPPQSEMKFQDLERRLREQEKRSQDQEKKSQDLEKRLRVQEKRSQDLEDELQASKKVSRELEEKLREQQEQRSREPAVEARSPERASPDPLMPVGVYEVIESDDDSDIVETPPPIPAITTDPKTWPPLPPDVTVHTWIQDFDDGFASLVDAENIPAKGSTKAHAVNCATHVSLIGGLYGMQAPIPCDHCEEAGTECIIYHPSCYGWAMKGANTRTQLGRVCMRCRSLRENRKTAVKGGCAARYEE